MADVSIHANCGCGYKAKRLEEAEKHSDRTGHRMTILGDVTPTVTIEKAEQPVRLAVNTDTMSKLNALRKSINGGV